MNKFRVQSGSLRTIAIPSSDFRNQNWLFEAASLMLLLRQVRLKQSQTTKDKLSHIPVVEGVVKVAL